MNSRGNEREKHRLENISESAVALGEGKFTRTKESRRGREMEFETWKSSKRGETLKELEIGRIFEREVKRECSGFGKIGERNSERENGI